MAESILKTNVQASPLAILIERCLEATLFRVEIRPGLQTTCKGEGLDRIRIATAKPRSGGRTTATGIQAPNKFYYTLRHCSFYPYLHGADPHLAPPHQSQNHRQPSHPESQHQRPNVKCRHCQAFSERTALNGLQTPVAALGQHTWTKQKPSTLQYLLDVVRKLASSNKVPLTKN